MIGTAAAKLRKEEEGMIEIRHKRTGCVLWVVNLADLQEADLQEADLRGADIRGANIRGADLDFSSGIPFWCGSFDIKADLRLAAQLAYHFCRIDFGDCEEANVAKAALKALANKFHRVNDDVPPID